MTTALVFVVGATATGKSVAALDIAEELKAEIINADASALYRGMDIGTAKLPYEERRGITHHMVDVLDIREDASVATYQRKTRALIDTLQSQGKSVVVVGGSGLYVSAVLENLEFPGTDQETRSRIEVLAAEIGTYALHERLAQLDPAAAVAILPTNTRRIVRALEVIEITGKPFTANLPRESQSPYPEAIRIGLEVDRPTLDLRIESRVEHMWATGFVEEVRTLEGSGLREGKTAQRSLGYAQILRAFDDEMSLEAAKEETVKATRKFARRQETWFARDSAISWCSFGAHIDRLELLLARTQNL